MKLGLKCAVVLTVVGVLSLVGYKVAFSHCEIPCGIYGDKVRIALFYEDIATVEKSMTQIIAVGGQSPINYNQLIRWVKNKEDHAGKIQHTVTQYFMTQRVKPKNAGDPAHTKYLSQLTALHGMLIHAMKAKQTTDVEHCKKLRQLADQFSAAYFSAEDLKHIREHHGKNAK